MTLTPLVNTTLIQRILSSVATSSFKPGKMSSALTVLAHELAVSQPLSLPSSKDSDVHAGRPAHHLNDTQTKFANPWPSFRMPEMFFPKILSNSIRNTPAVPKNISQLLPTQVPDWGIDESAEAIKATWLGHACYVVELPSAQGAQRGPRIIFDPALSVRCSPSQILGPVRYTPVPCKTEDIPVVDAIVLSHNHYDHTDTPTLQILNKRYRPHVFAPLGNGPYLESIGIPSSNIHTLDWWDSCNVTLSIPSAASPDDRISTAFKVTCTPCQHTSARGIFDRAATLWSSWAVEQVLEGGDRQGKKVYFAGDTAYRTVMEHEDENEVPVCPAFAEIGERIGPFDLALIPIGAYSPRWLFSNMHASPSDSIRIFQDIKAKKALAMHWGTWVLTTEDVMEPPRLLKKERDLAGVAEEDFDICGLGETRIFL